MKVSKWSDLERRDRNEWVKMKGSRKKGQKWRNHNEGIKNEGIELKESKWRDQERRDKNEGIKIKGSRKKG